MDITKYLDGEMKDRFNQSNPNDPMDVDIAKHLLNVLEERIQKRGQELDTLKEMVILTREIVIQDDGVNTPERRQAIDHLEECDRLIAKAESDLKDIKFDKEQLEIVVLRHEIAMNFSKQNKNE